jgi:hypothetical protein
METKWHDFTTGGANLWSRSQVNALARSNKHFWWQQLLLVAFSTLKTEGSKLARIVGDGSPAVQKLAEEENPGSQQYSYITGRASPPRYGGKFIMTRTKVQWRWRRFLGGGRVVKKWKVPWYVPWYGGISSTIMGYIVCISWKYHGYTTTIWGYNGICNQKGDIWWDFTIKNGGLNGSWMGA